jgi:hypothetical protein
MSGDPKKFPSSLKKQLPMRSPPSLTVKDKSSPFLKRRHKGKARRFFPGPQNFQHQISLLYVNSPSAFRQADFSVCSSAWLK